MRKIRVHCSMTFGCFGRCFGEDSEKMSRDCTTMTSDRDRGSSDGLYKVGGFPEKTNLPKNQYLLYLCLMFTIYDEALVSRSHLYVHEHCLPIRGLD